MSRDTKLYKVEIKDGENGWGKAQIQMLTFAQ